MFGPCSEESGGDICRAARLHYFCKHSATINGENKTHIMLTKLSWFLYYPKKDMFGKPITVWYNNLFEPCGVHTIVPVQLVKCRSVCLVDKLDHEDVYICCPSMLYFVVFYITVCMSTIVEFSIMFLNNL